MGNDRSRFSTRLSRLLLCSSGGVRCQVFASNQSEAALVNSPIHGQDTRWKRADDGKGVCPTNNTLTSSLSPSKNFAVLLSSSRRADHHV